MIRVPHNIYESTPIVRTGFLINISVLAIYQTYSMSVIVDHSLHYRVHLRAVSVLHISIFRFIVRTFWCTPMNYRPRKNVVNLTLPAWVVELDACRAITGSFFAASMFFCGFLCLLATFNAHNDAAVHALLPIMLNLLCPRLPTPMLN